MIETILCILGGYGILSSALFLFPFWKKKTPMKHPIFKKCLEGKGVMHISHRGGSREGFENTMEAFQKALQIGTNMLEMDVCYTKDKQVVVIHDSYLQRICGVDKHTSHFHYDELPKFQQQVRTDFSPDHLMHSSNIHFMPLLEEVFQKFPNTLINLEIKTPHHEINKAVNELIVKYSREDLTIWGAKNTKFSDDLYQVNPRIRRFFSLKRVMITYLCYLTGLLPFCSIPEDSLQIPLFTQDLYKWKLSEANTFNKKVQTTIFYNMVWFLNLISPPLFYHLKKRGISVIYWVLNEEQEFDRALKQGVTGIMTDCPTKLRDYLIKRKLFLQ